MKAELLLYVMLCASASSQTQILWNEQTDGSLSLNYQTPTHVPELINGTNYLIGQAEITPSAFGWTTYTDYFAFTVPSGLLVQSIVLTADDLNLWIWVGDESFSSSLGFVGFRGVGWTSVAPINGDLLPQMGLPSVLSGSYGMYVSNMDFANAPSTSQYSLAINAIAIPEPSTYIIIFSSIVLGFTCLKNRKPKRGLPRSAEEVSF